MIVASATLMFSEMRRICIIITLCVSIFAHWLMRPYRDASCNIMVVIFCICDLLGVMSNPTQQIPLPAAINTDNTSVALSPSGSANYDRDLINTTTLQTFFLVFLLFTILTAVGLTISSVVKSIRAAQKLKKIEAIRRQVREELLSADAVEKSRIEAELIKKQTDFSTCEIVLYVFIVFDFDYGGGCIWSHVFILILLLQNFSSLVCHLLD